MVGIAEANGINGFHETCGVEVLYDGDTVRGIRTGAKGLDADGGKKPNYEPGLDLTATVTVFEGTPFWNKTSGTSGPGSTPAGISTLT